MALGKESSISHLSGIKVRNRMQKNSPAHLRMLWRSRELTSHSRKRSLKETHQGRLGVWLGGGALAVHAQGPGFNPQYYSKKNKLVFSLCGV